MKLMASGDVSDFSPLVKLKIAQHFATMSGVPVSNVQVDVEPASVLISVTVIVPDDDAKSVLSTFERLLETPYDATVFLESVAGGSISILRIDEPPQLLSGLGDLDDAEQQIEQQSTDGSEGPPIGLIIGGGLGALAMIVVGYVIVAIVKRCGRQKLAQSTRDQVVQRRQQNNPPTVTVVASNIADMSATAGSAVSHTELELSEYELSTRGSAMSPKQNMAESSPPTYGAAAGYPLSPGSTAAAVHKTKPAENVVSAPQTDARSHRHSAHTHVLE